MVVRLTEADLDGLLVELAQRPGEASPSTVEERTRLAIQRIRELEATCDEQRATIEALQRAKTPDGNEPSLPFLARVMSMAAGSIDAWGKTAQERMVYEELGELQVALAQNGRGRAGETDVIEEAADVVLMAIEAAKLAGADPTDLRAAILLKLKRAEERVGSALWEGGLEELSDHERALLERRMAGVDGDGGA